MSKLPSLSPKKKKYPNDLLSKCRAWYLGTLNCNLQYTSVILYPHNNKHIFKLTKVPLNQACYNSSRRTNFKNSFIRPHPDSHPSLIIQFSSNVLMLICHLSTNFPAQHAFYCLVLWTCQKISLINRSHKCLNCGKHSHFGKYLINASIVENTPTVENIS